MKVGDRVVCIKYDPFEIFTGDFTDAPKVGDECLVNDVYEACGVGWLSLDGWDLCDHDADCFRKIEPNFTNALTRKLATDFIEEDNKVIETEREKVLI